MNGHAMISPRTATATRMGLREQLRHPFLLVLLVLIPLIFISWGWQVTATDPRTITAPGGGLVRTDMRELITIIDVPACVALLAGLVGVFVVLSALESDRRLVVSGFNPHEAITPRLVVLLAAVIVIVAVSILTMAVNLVPKQWAPFIAGNLLIGLEYAGLGAIAGALLGRLGAVYLILFLSEIDIGIAQDPLFFHGDPQGWATVLPGYGPTRVIIDAGLTPAFNTATELLIGIAWAAAACAALAILLRHAVKPSH